MKKLYLDESNRIWKDRKIKPEGKIIYNYIYSKGFDRSITDLNIWEIQPYIKITNKGLKNNLKSLEYREYIKYREYDNGMYMINLLG